MKTFAKISKRVNMLFFSKNTVFNSFYWLEKVRKCRCFIF